MSIIIFAIFIFFSSSINAEESIDELFKQADALFYSYHEDLGNLEKSIKVYEKIFEMDNKNVQSAIMISRAWLTYGDLVPKDEEGRRNAYTKGKEWAKRAMEIDNNSAQAHFWYFANLGRVQQLKGVIAGLKMLPELKREIHKAYELDPKDVMILDGIGTFYYEVPGIMGGDLKKSEELLKKAVELDPNYTLAWYDLAIALYKQKKYNEALESAKMVLSIEQPTYYADWVTWDKPLAEKLIKDIEEKLK
jgi:superkiller protein 3